MNWNSVSEFWAMGGYGLYVWGSFSVTFGLMVLEMVLARVRQRRALQTVLQSSLDESLPYQDGSP